MSQKEIVAWLSTPTGTLLRSYLFIYLFATETVLPNRKGVTAAKGGDYICASVFLVVLCMNCTL